MADNRIHETSREVVNSVREANQAVANTTVTVLDRNLKFAQTTFLSGIEVLERETDDLRNLAREWGQHTHKQQEAFEKVAYATMDTYMNFLHTCFSFYQQVWSVTHSAMDREVQFAQTAAQRKQQIQ